MPGAPTTTEPVCTVENRDGSSDVLLVCEHASNRFPATWGNLGLSAADRRAHIAWDPGALGVARGLMRRLDAMLVSATVSRLIYDLNRPPHAPGAIASKSEAYDIPGNAAVSPTQRATRTESVYLPFHSALHAEIARRLALGRLPAVITIHSFTPVYFGKRRAVEFGVIHDADPTLAHEIATLAGARTGLKTELNQPYSAADGVTHTLRVQATPYGIANAMLEIRNDLIASPEAEEKMAALVAPVLADAVAAARARARALT